MAIKSIDHIAIVVPNIEEAQAFYRDALGLEVSHVERVEDQEVIVAFLPTGCGELELLEPLNDTSGVAKFLQKRGPGIHHICLEVDSVEETLATLKAQGVELINEEPTIGSGGKKIAFVHPRSTYGVLIELYELTPEEPQRRAGILEELRTRFDIEYKAVSAGFSAFVKGLREGGRLPGNGRGIRIKPETQDPGDESGSSS